MKLLFYGAISGDTIGELNSVSNRTRENIEPEVEFESRFLRMISIIPRSLPGSVEFIGSV